MCNNISLFITPAFVLVVRKLSLLSFSAHLNSQCLARLTCLVVISSLYVETSISKSEREIVCVCVFERCLIVDNAIIISLTLTRDCHCVNSSKRNLWSTLTLFATKFCPVKWFLKFPQNIEFYVKPTIQVNLVSLVVRTMCIGDIVKVARWLFLSFFLSDQHFRGLIITISKVILSLKPNQVNLVKSRVMHLVAFIWNLSITGSASQ